jgi:hypothetical protein
MTENAFTQAETKLPKTDLQHATELFDLYKTDMFSLEWVLESARNDLKSEIVADLIMRMFHKDCLVKKRLNANP